MMVTEDDNHVGETDSQQRWTTTNGVSLGRFPHFHNWKYWVNSAVRPQILCVLPIFMFKNTYVAIN